ncbi:hypothetical protein HPT27_16175 [Permianibacter sp. IMCC34836]|uniref:BatA domain-containing protein n=1 Tax=Permianibacter fluminis TaxID=2738515 RepID=UPI0015573C48|nr:BatA domain-containing protein [Permianibacter fluminis]NQD38561.1 hypothetical protein [Permianibacter fluminis]
MELAFAAPLWAWAFASLAVPVLIHFFASRWQPPRRFAALRFLLPTAEQGRARRISDWLLLLLRCLLLALLVLALMTPTLSRTLARSNALTIVHPSLPMTDAELASIGALWLCRDGELARTRCPQDAAVFSNSLLQLAEQQPDLARVTAHVPPTIAVPAVALPALPIAEQWQMHDRADAAPSPIRTVNASADYAPLFAAANAVDAWPHWQLLSTSQAADLAIDNPEADARVLWHQEPLPWQSPSESATPADAEPAFAIAGNQLHLRSEPAAVLREHPERLAALLTQTEAWLARGDNRWQQPIAALQSWSVPELSGQQKIGLQMALFMAALLLLLLERGLAHGRR